MMINFYDPTYLSAGSPIQQMGWGVLAKYQVVACLSRYNPVIAGTLPLDLFIEGMSDIDILCEALDLEEFETYLHTCFSSFPHFTVRKKMLSETTSCIAAFHLDDFPIEIVGQPLPVRKQVAYRHMIIEHRLLEQFGVEFKNQVVQLKKKGIKTEPAFASLMDMQGDPYAALLKLEVSSQDSTSIL